MIFKKMFIFALFLFFFEVQSHDSKNVMPTNKKMQNDIIKIQNNYLVKSNYNDNGNIYHIFAKEVLGIWNKIGGNGSFSILLINYQDNEIGRWRKELYELLFRRVYINFTNESLEQWHQIIPSDSYDNWNYASPFHFCKTSHQELNINLGPLSTSSSCTEKHLFKKLRKKVRRKLNIEKKGKYIGFLLKGKNYRNLYDLETKMKLHEVLRHAFTNIPYKVASFHNMSFRDQQLWMSDVRILISVHGAQLTNIFSLPKNAHIFEIGFRKFWFCNPVCKKHLSGELKYTESCNRGFAGFQHYHLACYHNLAYFFGYQYTEIQVDDGQTFLDENPISVQSLFLNSSVLINIIKKALSGEKVCTICPFKKET